MKEKKLSIFWISMGVYVVIWIALTAAVSGKVWSICRDYQMNYDSAEYYSNPDLLMKEELNHFSSEAILELVNIEDLGISELETKENKIEYVKALVTNKELSYKRVENFSLKKPVYDIYAGDIKIGQVYMKQQAQSDNFGFHLCEVTKEEVIFGETSLYSEDIKTSLGTAVNVNGVTLDNSYLVESEVKNSYISKQASELTGVTLGTDTYHIEGLLKQPEVEFTKVEQQQLDEEMTKQALAANEAYIKNMNLLLDINALTNYFEGNGAAWANIKSAQAGLAWSGKPTTLEIKSAEISDVAIYSEDVMVVTTKSVVYRDYREKEYTEEMNYEWLYIKKNGNWRIRDFSFAN